LENRKAAAKAENKPGSSGVKKASSKVKAVSNPKRVAKKTSKNHPATDTPAEPTKVATSWVLRAATPGEAWVSGDATSADLRHVQVGDELPGIGKVKSITQSPNGWEIDGSEATIR